MKLDLLESGTTLPELHPLTSRAAPTSQPENAPDAIQVLVARGVPVQPPVVGRADKFAIASAVVGLTAFVPILSQVAGIVLGIVALRRIRKSELAGIPVGGRAWAITGLVSSAFLLLSWLFVFAVVGGTLALFGNVAGNLDQVVQVTRPH